MDEEREVVVYSDFNCPYCYSLNERLLALGEKGRTAWRGIEHLPAADSSDRGLEVQMMVANEVAVIRRRAPDIEIAAPTFIPSTARANRLVAALERTTAPGPMWALRTAIARAYWKQGLDISDPAVLADLCRAQGLAPPPGETTAVEAQLKRWQLEWEAERFGKRLPALLSKRGDKPLLGFPTLDLLYAFISDGSVLTDPASMATCEMRPRQQILVVGGGGAPRVTTRELESPYLVRRLDTTAELDALLAAPDVEPDLVVLDVESLGAQATAAIARIRRDPVRRSLPVVVLLPRLDPELEMRCFDAGATDVVFDLSNPKVTQARLELHLRLQRSTALLRSMASFDYLTELINRREFDRRMEEEWARCRRAGTTLALCMVDIDHFKNYNDRLGHDAGDDCLRRVAAALRSAARRPGDVVARYGGEEFVVLLPDTDLAAACGRGEAIVEAVRALALPHPASPTAPLVTVSVGTSAVQPTDRHLPTQLVNAADAALYRAKDGGRDRCVRGAVPGPLPPA